MEDKWNIYPREKRNKTLSKIVNPFDQAVVLMQKINNGGIFNC